MRRNRYSAKEAVLRDLLKARRRELGFRQDDLAAKLDVPQSFISKYESGERLLTFVETLAICKALSLDPATLLGAYLSHDET